MHYKYLLAMLAAGLYEEFWEEVRRGLVPFFDPDVYGRSILENCSFVVSSAHPDSSLHGRGFVARLSGATAEFMSMWSLATVGPRPFVMSESGLALRFVPALPGWLFREDGTLSFTFLGKIKVTYHNPGREDVFPGGAIDVTKMRVSGEEGDTVEVEGARLEEPWASQVRERRVASMDVFLG
jgi:hypothetical protein